MPNYRRYYVPGGTYFFTLVAWRRRRIFAEASARKCLRQAIEKIQRARPFEIPAIVVLHDHLHALWTLPPGDCDYSTRWRRIKAEFTANYLACGGQEIELSKSRIARKERGIWQRRYWEHQIDDENDFERHFDYIHYNPVKHRLVRCPRLWKWTSFHHWQQQGVYGPDWGCASRGLLDFDDIANTVGE